MKFRFPIFIIDEDYRSENASGLGVRALASAIEAEGMEVIGVTSYGDLSSFAQQQSRASAFILSIDGLSISRLRRLLLLLFRSISSRCRTRRCSCSRRRTQPETFAAGCPPCAASEAS